MRRFRTGHSCRRVGHFSHGGVIGSTFRPEENRKGTHCGERSGPSEELLEHGEFHDGANGEISPGLKSKLCSESTLDHPGLGVPAQAFLSLRKRRVASPTRPQSKQAVTEGSGTATI